MFIIIPRSWLGSALGLLVIKNERIEIPKKSFAAKRTDYCVCEKSETKQKIA